MLPILQSVLIVEDGILTSLDLEDLFEDMGAREIAAAGTLCAATRKLGATQPSLVTLDIDLGDGSSDTLVPALRDRDIPFIVISGRSPDALPSAFHGAVVVAKPVSAHKLRESIAAAFQARSTQVSPSAAD